MEIVILIETLKSDLGEGVERYRLSGLAFCCWVEEPWRKADDDLSIYQMLPIPDER